MRNERPLHVTGLNVETFRNKTLQSTSKSRDEYANIFCTNPSGLVENHFALKKVSRNSESISTSPKGKNKNDPFSLVVTNCTL